MSDARISASTRVLISPWKPTQRRHKHKHKRNYKYHNFSFSFSLSLWLRSRYAREKQTYTQAQQLAAVLAVSQKYLVTIVNNKARTYGLYLYLAFVFTRRVSLALALILVFVLASLVKTSLNTYMLYITCIFTIFTC